VPAKPTEIERHRETSFPYKGEPGKLTRWVVKFNVVLICGKCQQPIVSGQNFGFVCFKIPGREDYHFFHRRFPGGDCWEAYVRNSR
jgi:hypothetical protein